MEIKCNGSEDNISDCEYRNNGITGNCQSTIELQCFESNYSSFTTPIVMTVPNTQQHIQQYSTTNSDGTTIPTPSDLRSENSNSILKSPSLYYFIIGLAAVVIAMMLLVLVMMIFCCYKRLQLKEISPYNVEKQNGFTKDRDTTLHLEDLTDESTSINHGNHGLMMHHQLQQSSPVYNGIQSCADNTNHSQENFSSRSAIVATNGPPLSSPHPLQGSEFYSLVNSSETYFQLEMHIPTTALTRAEPINSDSGYQQLDHKTSSLKRHMMPITHTANNAEGFLEEEEFENSKYNLTRDVCLSSQSTPLQHNRSLERPNLEVQLQVDDLSSNVDIISEQENFYQTIGFSPDYASIKELDEGSGISTNAMCNNCITRNSYENSVVNPLKCLSPSIPECPDNSGPVPSLPVTCSLSSSSAQISRASDSPLVSKDCIWIAESPELPRNKLDNKYTYPEITKPNRFPSHSVGYTFTLV